MSLNKEAEIKEEDFSMEERVTVLEFTGLKLYISREQVGEKSIKLIEFRGRIDNQNAYKLNRKIYNLLLTINTDIIINLESLEHINSVGIAILFSIFHRQKENNKLVLLAAMNSFLYEVFNLVYLPSEVIVEESVELAKKRCEG